MKELVLIACYWLHLAVTTMWVGGIFFILFILMPSSRQVFGAGAGAGKLMGDVSRRFAPLVNYGILLLVVTGVVLASMSRQFTGTGALENRWTALLMPKVVLALVMIGVHFYRGLILAPRIKRAPEAKKAALQRLSLNLVHVNLALGLLVLLLSGALSVYRGY